MDPTQAISKLRWRQGSVIPADLVERALKFCEPAVRKEILERNPFLIVTSQDCDILHESLSAEPWVELIAITVAEKEDGNFLNLRNPRRLQFYLTLKDKRCLIEAIIHDRCRIPRELLACAPPSNEALLQPDQLSGLVRWLARRYERTAMPDEFDRRLQPCRAEIKKLLGKAAAVIQQLLIYLDSWEELPEGTSYTAIVLGTMRADDYKETDKIRAVEGTLLQLEQIVNEVGGIDIRVEVRSETDVSLHDLRYFYPWDFESLSFSDRQSG
jgi:hypothetical protein